VPLYLISGAAAACSSPRFSDRYTILEEIDKLERVRALGLPADLFADCSEKLLGAWRARAAACYPSDLRAMPQPIRLTLLAALCWSRTAEITDALVGLLIDVVDKIRVRAENRVEKALVADLKKVHGKHGLLFALAEAAVEHPDETVRRALFPVVPEATLRDLVNEAKATEQLFRQRVRKEIRGSYSNHYRRMLPRILEALEFRCANHLYRPVMDALELLHRHLETPGQQRFYATGEQVAIKGVVPDEWRQAVRDEHGRIERIPYELCVLRALRDALRRREIWVSGAHRWRNPDEDLPADFDANRDVHYAAIRKPRDPQAFISDLQARLHAGLERLNQAVSTNTAGGVRITTRRGRPWIVVPAIGQLPNPPNIRALHAEIQRRHGMLDLLAVLKDADHLSNFTAQLTSVVSREITDPATARRRKLLVTFGIGSNIGIKRIAEATDGHPADTEAALRRFRRLYFTRDGLRRAIIELANTTLHARDVLLWGAGTTCTSDSKQFGSWDSNLMTEWHNRYGGAGVMVYWHVEKKQLCIHSQLTTCSLRGRRDAPRAPASRHRRRDRGEHHRHPRRLDRRLRVLRAARLQADAPPQADRPDPALPTRPADRWGVGGDQASDLRPADQLGSDRPAVRRARQIRHRAQARHRRSPTAPATVHARRAQAPSPPGDGRAPWPREEDLRMRLPLRESASKTPGEGEPRRHPVGLQTVLFREGAPADFRRKRPAALEEEVAATWIPASLYRDDEAQRVGIGG